MWSGSDLCDSGQSAAFSSLWATTLGILKTQCGGFPRWRYPQIIQAIRSWLNIETYGDLGILHFKKPSYGNGVLISIAFVEDFSGAWGSMAQLREAFAVSVLEGSLLSA